LGRGYEIRFIELMPVGKGKEHTGMRQGEIRALLEDAFGALEPVRERTGNGPAECLRARRQGGAIGFISPLSHAFCGRCNRVRLTASGFLQTCLHHADGCDLKALLRSGASDAALAGSIRDAVRTKPRAHNFASPAAAHGETPFLMNSIGG
jgi:cyclic pyranopterin phosphate synthase